MIPVSLLSPARNLAVGKAAIDSGADAVYIGAPAFSARQAAGNSIGDIRSLAEYAHLFGCKVLVALNTLLTEEEIPQAVSIAWQIYHAGADALIIQDLNLLRQDLPPIRLHASTQCDNRSVEKVRQMQQLGFKRVVLARELSLQQIKLIHSQTDVELEAFVHGALCVSYSGCCYMSEALCGRSANRGCCAQPCRQAWDLLDSDGNTMLKNQYLLSLHDMDRSTLLRQMLDAGITTLKIEGRLKDEAYVRNITAYYRLLLDQLLAQPDSPYCRASKGNIHLDFTPNPEKTFHRGGIDYFLNGQPSPDTHYANFLTPKSTGEQVGKVLAVNGNNITVQVKKGITLHNGDGLCFGDKGFMINTARLTGNQQYLITTAEPVQIRPQETLFRNQDIEFLSRLRHTRTRRLLPADILLKETPNGFLLKIADRQKEFTADKVPAKNEERALQTVKEQLSKLGDTCYEAQSVSVVWQKPYFIPVSTLNDWRRQLTTLPYQDGNRENTEETESKETRIQSQPYCAPLPEVLMTCRYCLLRELGRCRKTHPRKDGAEPAYIRNGKNRFRLRFDCQQCQMQILRAD